MSRAGSLRPFVIALALLVSSLVVGATPAYASHHRYATIYWERVLSHPNPAEVQVKITIEIGARLSFPWGTPTTPTVGTVVTYGGVNFDKAAKVGASATLVTSMTFTPTVTAVDVANDTLYGAQTFTLTYPATSNPVNVTFANCCRLSTLLDGNNDANMQVAALIDITKGTRSPKSTSLPVINVTVGVQNDVLIPTVAFDNFTNRIRVATTTESGLPNTQPVAPSVFSIDSFTPGLLHFTPRVAGLYAVQLIITSYDASGVAKSSVPLDFMFLATVGSAYTATVSSPATTYTVTIGSPMTATVNATLTPQDATYTAGINNTPLPAGMTFTVPANNGVGPTTGTINYTPTVTSTGSVVCFQSAYTKSGFPVIYSAGQLCLTFNIGAAPTTLTGAFVGVQGGAPAAVGNPMTVQATLTRTADSAPVPGRQVSFFFIDDPATIIGTATTNASGVATLTFTPALSTPARTMQANFTAVVNDLYLGSTGFISVPAVSGFSPLVTVQQPPNGLVGASVPVAAQLLRQVAPAGPVAGATVSLTDTAPGGATTTVSGTTSAGGVFATTIAPTVPGVHSIAAQYSGGGGSATSTAASFTMYQRALLSMPGAINGTAGGPTSVTATLTAVPQGTPIAGQTVTFSFAGVVGPQLATTDASGVATVSVVFPAGGSFTASASFLNAAAFYTNRTGSIPPAAETVSTPVSIVSASSSLANLTVASIEFAGNSLPVSTVLIRTSAPAGPVAGATVVFTLAGASTVTLPATTDVNGLATVTFPSLPARGVHTVIATYAGGAGFNPATSSTATVNVYQRASLLVSPATGFAGSSIPVTAALAAVPSGAPLSGQTVTFSFGGVVPSQSATTDASGTATVVVNFPSAGSFPAVASFANMADFFADQNGNLVASVASAPVTVLAASTSLSPINVASIQFVGTQLTASTVLSRTSTPAGTLAGQPVVFTIAGASSAALTAMTDANGFAQVSFPLATKGAHTVSAAFAGSASLAGSSSGSAPFSVYQRTQIAFTSTPATAGAVSTVTATLVAVPANTPIANATIAFDFDGPVLPQSVLTNGAGVASAQVTFPASGVFTALASFLDVSNFYANAAGSLATELAITTITVTPAATSLSPLVASANNLVGNDLTVSTVLTRTSAPAGPVAGVPVAFTLGGGPTLVGMTDASGAASVTFTSLSTVGSQTVSAMFAGDGALEPATASSVVSVYQRTALALAPAVSTAGSSVALQAVLLNTPGGQPLVGQAVTFSFGGILPPTTATTDASGVASITVQFPGSGTFPVSATFSNAAAFFTDAAGSIPPVPTTATTDVTVSKAATSLATPVVPAATLIGDVASASTMLMRSSAPTGPVAGATVTFTVTHSGGATSTLTAVTDAAGTASVAVPSTVTGSFTVTASFAGDSALDASASGTASSSVYQRAALSLNAPSGSAGTAIAVAATLLGLPANQPLAGQVVTFTFTGAGAPGPMLATTNAAGVATVSPTFATPGVFAVQAAFLNAGAFFTNSAGALPPAAELATSTVEATNNAPTFTAPADISVPATSASGATVSFTASGSDVEDGPLAAVCSPASPGTFPIGTTLVSCTVTDAFGASASGTFTVTVTNNAPTFTPPANIVAEATSASGAAVVFTAMGNDLEQGALPAVCSPLSGSTFALGTTTVSCTVTDQAGAEASGSFTVTVRDTTAPAIAAHGNEIREATSAAGAVVSFTAPSYTDAVGGNGVATCAPASGSSFAVATTTVTCTANDGQGNTATSSFTVKVADTTPPALTLPSNITVHASSAAGATVTYATSSLDLVAGVRPVVCSSPSGGTFPLGTTTVTCTSSDLAGNTSRGLFTVTVTNVAPVCSAIPSVSEIWPPNHRMVPVGLTVTDADGDTVSINVTGIFQDEPTNTAGDGNTSSDAAGVGTASPQVRAERSGTPKVPGNGRVYHIFYSATDQVGASCSAVAKVGVPHDQGNRSTLVDDGVRFNAVTGAKVP